jgi:uncharacterized membrane protein
MSTTLQTAPAIAAPAGTSRIASVDIIRGAVMVIMAIDHVRVYSGLPAGGPHVRNFLHPLDHAFLRARLHLPRRHQHLFLRP